MNKKLLTRIFAGLSHADEMKKLHQTEEFPYPPEHKLLLVYITDTTIDERGSVYEAARWAWRLSPERAKKADYVLAQKGGIVVGVFIAEQWIRFTREAWEAAGEDFPAPYEEPERYGFVGAEASADIQEIYLNKRVPDKLAGGQNPVRYSYEQPPSFNTINSWVFAPSSPPPHAGGHQPDAHTLRGHGVGVAQQTTDDSQAITLKLLP